MTIAAYRISGHEVFFHQKYSGFTDPVPLRFEDNRNCIRDWTNDNDIMCHIHNSHVFFFKEEDATLCYLKWCVGRESNP